MRNLFLSLFLISLLSTAQAAPWKVAQPAFPVWGQPGEVVELELTGPAGTQPKVTLGPSGTPLGLRETSKGHYWGAFRVPKVGPRDLILHGQAGPQVLGRVSASPVRKTFTATDTVVTRQGAAPLFDRHTPLLEGARVPIDGSRGNWHRAALSGIWLDGSAGKVEAGILGTNRVNRVIIENLSGGDAGLRFQCQQIPQFEAVHYPDRGLLELTLYASHTVFDIKRPTAVANFLGVVATRPATLPQTVKFEIQTGSKGIGGYSFERGKKEGEFLLRVRKPLPRSLKGLKITLDAGHGGPEDTGTVGHGGLPEKTLNLRVTKALAKMLQGAGAEVILTRDSDLDLDLRGRAVLSQAAGSQLFLSLHHNARPNVEVGRRYHGTDVYWYQPQSQPLARALADPIADALGEPLRSSRYRSFYVVRETHTPAVLIEFQYLSNPDLESSLLDQADYPDKAAAAVVKGLKRYLSERP